MNGKKLFEKIKSMRTIHLIKVAITILICSFFLEIPVATGQTTMPEVMDTGTLRDQLNYIHERTRIYENYRAIREDIFQKMRSNTMDSLSDAKLNINNLELLLSDRNAKIDSLNRHLQTTENDLTLAIKNKNILSFLGITMSKTYYNTIMWSVIIALIALLVLLFLTFARNRTITVQLRKDLNETREEFEEYRKTSRERYEQLVVSHFNEIKKLKEAR
jgi:preprotein translocase subunit SecF